MCRCFPWCCPFILSSPTLRWGEDLIVPIVKNKNKNIKQNNKQQNTDKTTITCRVCWHHINSNQGTQQMDSKTLTIGSNNNTPSAL